jgi:uncharacterized protein (TIGR00255 family)
MTGFGRGVVARVTVDVRAVNHRFLDVKLRGAAIAPAVEERALGRVRAAIERGAVVVTIHLARDGGGARVDRDAARAAHAELAEVARALGVPGPDLALVLAQPGVLVDTDAEADGATDAAIAGALDAALGQLDAMRAAEGQALARDLDARFAELAALRARIAELAAGVPGELARRLGERVRKLAGDAAVDPARLAQEIAVYADRADVSEELVRLASHLDQASALLAAAGSTGRRLDFLAQEIGRELNTIGSKSTLADISALVVDAKATLEKAREQIQNVE